MKRGSPNTPYKVVFYPSLTQMTGNPYWSMLASGLTEAGVVVVDEPESYKIGWLFRNRGKIDILHIHYFQSLYCNSGRTRARLIYVIRFALYLILANALGFCTVFTLHNLKPTNPLKPQWIDFLGHWVATNFSERVIVHCNEARRLLASRYGRHGRVYVVEHPNYIHQYPNTISKMDARKLLILPEEAIVFTFFGGIRSNKGIETLIQAFLRLESDSFRLLIAGSVDPSDPIGKSIQEYAKSNPRISFDFRHIPEDEIQNVLNSTDIVVLPFLNILTSGSAMLALSFGRPVIAPRMGCLPELIEPDGGWLFEPENIDSLAKTMLLAASSDFNKTGQNGLSSISNSNKARFAQQTVDSYWR